MLEKRDVSGDYKFSTKEKGGKVYKQASGELGHPDTTLQHHDPEARRAVSGGTGDDAGHLIKKSAGAPEDVRNLSRQNWISNRIGSWRSLEKTWDAKQRSGIKINVTVTDVTKKGEKRPYWRHVEWTETSINGTVMRDSADFLNTTSKRGREQEGVK